MREKNPYHYYCLRCDNPVYTKTMICGTCGSTRVEQHHHPKPPAPVVYPKAYVVGVRTLRSFPERERVVVLGGLDVIG